MTDKEIIKALADRMYCGKWIGKGFLDKKDFQILKNALDLINRQQAEIEKLNVELVGMRGACNSYKMHYDNAKTENERLQVRLRKERHQFEDLGKMYSEIRAETIKELEAKIHEKLHEAEMHGNFEPVVTREMFDSVVKEVVGEGNG